MLGLLFAENHPADMLTLMMTDPSIFIVMHVMPFCCLCGSAARALIS